jgi:hypothetical protein
MGKLWIPFAAGVLLWTCLDASAQDPNFQYRYGDIAIPRPSVDEPTISKFSMNGALDYLDKGALAWARDQKCVSCAKPLLLSLFHGCDLR